METIDYRRLLAGLFIIIAGFILLGAGIWITGALLEGSIVGTTATVAVIKAIG